MTTPTHSCSTLQPHPCYSCTILPHPLIHVQVLPPPPVLLKHWPHLLTFAQCSDPAPSLLSRKLSQGDHGALGVAGAQPAADPLHLRERERHHHLRQRKSPGKTGANKLGSWSFLRGLSRHTSVCVHAAAGDHRGVQQEPRRQRGRRHGQVQGGQRQVPEAVWDAG